MSRIELNVVATGNFKNLETSLTRLRSQVAALNTSLMGGRGGDVALTQVGRYVKGFEDAIDASGMFERHMVSITSETQKFGRSLEAGNMRIGQLFRAAKEYRRGELGQIRQLAREQVRMMNATTVMMPDGRAQVIVPRGIDEGIEKQRILNQEYRIFRQVVKNGSTEIINWGKNTQWAGRQLTVGLTVPLTIFGATAGKMFMDADKQLVRLAKVYGDATKGMVDSAELDKIRSQTLALSQELASGLGIAAAETMGIAADIAATGREGNELLESTREAIRLSVLGEVDRQEAMRATLSIQSVFKKDTEGLADSINLLNAVENQTSTSLNDLVEGIVKAGPVVQGLGGDIEDLALMMVAMREGGIPAAEAANAIKSSLASLINPTKQTQQLMNGFGIDLVEIVDKNAGNVIGTLVDLQSELSGLNDLSRQRAIEQIFGKFQFSRINAMLSNIGRAGSQTEQVLAIAGMSTAELAETAERELTAMTESVSGKFTRALETLKANLIPIGEAFVQIGTFLMNVGNKVLEVFNAIPEPIKNIVKGIGFLTALAGPVIMITGVLGNFFGYIVKGISSVLALKKAGRGMFTVFTPESVAATRATETLTESLFDQKVAMGEMSVAVTTLVQKLETLVAQLHEVGGAASNFDQVGAKAEAAAAKGVYGIPGGTPFSRRTSGGGLVHPGLVYSHLTARSGIESSLGKSAAERVMGMGTFVSGERTKEVNRLLGDFAVDLTSVSEETVTDDQRRRMLSDVARSRFSGNPKQLQEALNKIQELSSQELAQLIPSWQKIAAQTGEYVGTLEAAKVGLESNLTETKALLEQYKLDVESVGPEQALKNLKTSLSKIGIDVQSHIDNVSQDIEKIRSEISYLPSEQRPAALVERFTSDITARRELPALDAIRESGVTAFGKDGYQETMLYAAQQLTDEMFNSGQITAEMASAMKRVLEASLNQERASAELAQSQKDLDAANDRAKRALDAAYKDPRDLSSAEKIDGRWFIDGKVVGQKQKELIAALEEREAQLKRNVAAGEQLIDAEDRYRETTSQLENQREQEINQSKEGIVADEEKQQATTRATDAENIDTVETIESAQTEQMDSDASRNLASAENLDAARTRRGGRAGRGAMGAFGALSAVGMITSMIPTGEPDSGASQAMDVVGGVTMGAGMGAMLGTMIPIPVVGTAVGAAAGAILGGIGPVMNILSTNSENAAKELERLKLAAEVTSGKILDLERSTFNIAPLKTLEDLPLDNFKLETENATSQLYQFTEALKMAEEGTAENLKVQQFSQMGSAEELISSSMFQQMMLGLVQSGASEQTIKTILGGYLSASGKQEFAGFVNSEIERIFDLGNTPQEIGINYANGLKEIADEALRAAGLTPLAMEVAQSADVAYERARQREDGSVSAVKIDGQDADVFDVAQLAQQYAAGRGMSNELLYQYLKGNSKDFLRNIGVDVSELSPEQIIEINQAVAKLVQSVPNVAELATEFQNASVASNALAQSLEYAFTAADPTAIKNWVDSVNPEELERNSATLQEFLEGLRATGEGGKNAADAFMSMRNSGTSAADALMITRMIISDVNTDWQQLAAMARNNPAEFEIVWTQYVQGAPPGNTPASGATMPEDIGGRLAGSIDWSGGSSSGGAGGTSAIDEQIKAQDKLIEKIKEEREERQKLLNLEKEAFSFAMKEQDLKNQIAQARAEGRMADAALLQSQLDTERELNEKQEAERRRQEQEDKKIEAAQKEKERLQEQKRGSSGGGGGGDSGPSKQQQEWTANRINILTSGVINWTEGAQLRRETLRKGPWSAFFESDRVKAYREELEKLGVPLEEIDSVLNEMFDSWIENNSELFSQTEEYKFIEDALGDLKIGAEGVKEILPEAFSVLLDKNLTDDQKLQILTGQIYDLGYETDEARSKAKKLFDLYNENEFESEGIDQEIEKWILFNDTIDNLKKDLDSLTSEEGPLAADAARWTSQALAVTEGRYTYDPATQTGGATSPINAGGVMIDPSSLNEDGQTAGQALVQGLVYGIDYSTREGQAAAKKMADAVSKSAENAWEISSPSKLFERYGKFLIEGLSNGISSGESNDEIKTSFSTMIEDLQDIIVNGFIEVPDEISPPIQNAGNTFYNIMTESVQKTANEITKILKTTLPGHSFDIVGTPKIYVASGTDSIWSNVLGPSFNSLEITRVPPAFAKGGKVVGPGGPTEDKILAQLSDGEYVVKAAAVKQYGVDFLDTLNAQKYAVGGYVSADRAEREAQNRTISNNTANQVGGYAGQAMRQPYYGSSSNSYSPPTSQPTSSNQRPLSIADRMSMYESSPGVWLRSGIDDDAGPPMGSILAAALARDLRRETAAGLMSLTNDPYGAAQLAGMSEEDYMKYANSSDFWIDLGWFSTNFIPFAAGAKWLGRGINVIRKTKPVRAVSNAYDISKYKIRNNYSNEKKKVGEVGGRVLASAMLGLDRGVGGLGRNVDTLNDVTRSSSRQVLSAEDMTRIDIQSQVKAMRETYRASRTLPRKSRPIDDMTVARSISEYTSQQDWDDLVAFANANGMDWESIVANMATDPEAFQRATFIKQQFLEERSKKVSLAQQNDPTYRRLLADNDRAAKEFRDSFNQKWQELYGDEDPLFLPEPTLSDYSHSRAGIELGHRYESVFPGDVFINDPDRWTSAVPMEIRNGRIARVMSEIVGGDLGTLAPIFEKSTSRAADRLSTQVYAHNPQVFNSKAELLQSSYPERIFEYYYGTDPFSVLRELSYRDGMGYLDGMSATGSAGSIRHAAALIDPLYQELGEQASLVAAKTLYPDINWTVDTPIQISKVWAGAMPVKDGDFGAIANLPRADRVALNEGAHLTGSGIGTVRLRPGLSINDYQNALRRGYTIPGREKYNSPGEYRTETPITFPGNPSDSHSTDELLGEILEPGYSMSQPFGPTGLAIHFTPGMGHTYSTLNPHVAGFWTYNPQASSMGMFADPDVGLGGATAARLGVDQDALNSAQGSIRLGDTFGTFGLGAEQQILVPPARINNLSPLKGMSKSLNTKAIMENRGTVNESVILGTAYVKSGSRRFKYRPTTQSMDRDEYNSLMSILDEYDKYGDRTGGPRFTKDQLLEAVIITETDGRYTISANPHYMNYLGKDFLDRISVINDVQSDLLPRGLNTTLDQEDIAELTDAFWRSRLERLKAESGLGFDPNDTSPHSMAEIVSQEEIDIYNAALDNPLSLGNYSNESVRDAVGIVESIIGKQLYVDTNISSKYRLWKAGSYTPKDIDEVRAFQMIDATENPQIPWLPTVGSFSFGHHRATAPGFRVTAPTSPPPSTKLDVVERISRPRPKKPSRDTSDDIMLAQGGLVRLNKSEMSILGKEMTDYASQFVGTPYSPNSFNYRTGPDTGDEGWGCATAMEWLFNNKAGMSLGNKSLSWGQYQSAPGKYVSEGNNLPGDLLYFYYPNGVNTQNPINHTGMYVGGGRMFHAQNPAAGTNITGIDSDNLFTKGPYAKRPLPETIAGMGVPVGRFKMGGPIYGQGGPTSDNLLAWVSNGEYVISADTVKHYGKDFMDALNSMELSEFATGGLISRYPSIVAKMGGGSTMAAANPGKLANYGNNTESNVEYNINVQVLGTNASPDDIAREVMRAMQQREHMKGSRTRI